VGVVLNMITRGAGKYDYQYGYYYTTYRPETSKGGKRRGGGKNADSGADTKFAGSSSSGAAEREADLDLQPTPNRALGADTQAGKHGAAPTVTAGLKWAPEIRPSA